LQKKRGGYNRGKDYKILKYKSIFMEGKNNTNEEVKKIEEQHEKVKKAGAVAAATLSAFLNIAPVAAAGYTPPTEPGESPELIVPKTGAEQSVNGEVVLRPGMTPSQIDAAAKEAVAQYEMDQNFKQVLQDCTEKAAIAGDAEQGIKMCVNWYKSEADQGRSQQAFKAIQQSLREMSAKTSEERILEAKEDKTAILTIQILVGATAICAVTLISKI